ncbi:ABC-type transport auxiliary lipoprotein family protein [Sphingomicrobium sediminis]|uniref:ABC transporter n=1 Tax=Sphingomicrobium sediminis TaxID=2950949 RepID=A0A9X2EHR4_9SPHN|nr:ABC transporter [Sphingomicrobium sediminis]MCM8557782.1 ABC transporter [Sphingomicrobium sediminis]
MRSLVILLATGALAACSVPGLSGPEVPPSLTTLASSAPEANENSVVRSEAVSFALPLLPQAYNTNRVAAIEGGTAIAYIEGLMLVDRPDRLFQQLVSETVYRRTDLLVIDPRQAAGTDRLNVTGTLYRFDYDGDRGEVVVGYEAMWSDGEQVATRRFEASAGAAPSAASVSTALNRAANDVAEEVAAWISGS